MTVSPEYFRVMGIPLRRGRLLTPADEAVTDALVAVISQSAATRYWGDRDPIGAFGRFGATDGSRFQVVGVTGDVRNDGLGKAPVPEFYISSAAIKLETMEFVVRSTRPAGSIVPEIRRAVQSVDAELPIHQVATMNDIVRRSITLERAASLLTTLFALAALVLATLGIYGIVAYVVRLRRVEIGTRMALGATSRNVLALVVSGGMRTAALGVVVGAAIGLGSAVYLVRAFDLGAVGFMPFLAATVIVGAVTLAASGVPAWRATLYSPMIAIRDQPESLWQAIRRRRG
jgi:putative ABC transport system permease protein